MPNTSEPDTFAAPNPSVEIRSLPIPFETKYAFTDSALATERALLNFSDPVLSVCPDIRNFHSGASFNVCAKISRDWKDEGLMTALPNSN